jgi:hypothetical protein
MLQMLDDFVDVSKDEKQFMHLWNSFMRKSIFVFYFYFFSSFTVFSVG